MSKKDYIKFAAMIKERMPEAKQLIRPDSFIMLDEIARAMADIFQDDNPNFNRDRFLKACGIE